MMNDLQISDMSGLRLSLTRCGWISVFHRIGIIAKFFHQLRCHLILAEENAAVKVFTGKDSLLEDVCV